MKKELQNFEKLLLIMDELREKCPWDKKQTLESLRYLTIEEVYELAEAILDNNHQDINGELGDLMLHLVFYAKLGSESGTFDINSVLEGINKKLIERHPHVFGDVQVSDENEVKENWEKIKLNKGRKGVLDGVPVSLPSMVKAFRIQEKARGVGFEWETPEQVWEKVIEELNELRQEAETGQSLEKTEEEFGDLMFALVNYGRFLNINAENALEKTNRKFIRRFKSMENLAKSRGLKFENLNLDQQDKLWNEIKTEEKKKSD
jgi:XTP/dITP diphosphohydrolase